VLFCCAAARDEVSPPVESYYWVGEDGDATSASNWESVGSTGALPSEGAHLVFNPNADEPEQTISGFGDAALPTHYGSLWIDTGPCFTLDANGYYDPIYDPYKTTLSGKAITLGYGTEAVDRLLVARGFSSQHLDLDIAIHTAGGFAFSIHNGLYQLREDDLVGLYFEKTLTNHGPLIVDGHGHTFIDTLLGSGSLLKDGTGTLRISDSSAYTGDITIRGGIFAGARSAAAFTSCSTTAAARSTLRATSARARAACAGSRTVPAALASAAGPRQTSR